MIKLRYFFLVLLLSLSSLLYAQKEIVLEKVTVVSRHSVRAPLDRYLNTLDEMTGDGYKWRRWSVPGSHLTLKGGALETLFGEYFRLWLQNEDMILDSADIYLGASSKQRTIATARSFAAGAFPMMTINVDYKVDCNGEIGVLDPDYLPLLNADTTYTGSFNIEAFQKEAYRELGELKAPDYTFLEKVLRMKHSEYSRKHNSSHFNNDVGVCLDFYDKKGERLEPTMQGGLKDANMASDAFILQYYESDKDSNSIFDYKLNKSDWQKLASIKDDYDYILFEKAPIVAVNISHCMMKRIQAEMKSEGHKFAMFCTHDSMIAALLTALRVLPYELENTIEAKTPIGFKLLIEQWAEKCEENPERYVRVSLIYQSSDQIREMRQLDLSNPPESCELSIYGLEKLQNGMYRYDDFMNHIQKCVEAFAATARGEHPWE